MNSRSVIINGMIFYQQKSGKKITEFCCNGQYFETYEELLIAEMLTLMNIKFMHHVNFLIPIKGHTPSEVIWCPDFVFCEPWRWVGKTCNGSVIVGLEAKRTHIKGKPSFKSRALLSSLGIPILLVNYGDIEPHYLNDKRLPLKPLNN